MGTARLISILGRTFHSLKLSAISSWIGVSLIIVLIGVYSVADYVFIDHSTEHMFSELLM